MACGLESHVITIVDVLTVSIEDNTVELSNAMPARAHRGRKKSTSPSRAVEYLSIHLCSLQLHRCILRIKPTCLLQFHSLNILIGIVWSAVVTKEHSLISLPAAAFRQPAQQVLPMPPAVSLQLHNILFWKLLSTNTVSSTGNRAAPLRALAQGYFSGGNGRRASTARSLPLPRFVLPVWDFF